MSSPCVAFYLVAAADCPNCRKEQKTTTEGRTIYVIELCHAHTLSAGFMLPTLVTIRVRTQTSIVAVVDDSEGCLRRGICPACRERPYLGPEGDDLWGACKGCGAAWSAL